MPWAQLEVGISIPTEATALPVEELTGTSTSLQGAKALVRRGP
jgi:hypothetical protein